MVSRLVTAAVPAFGRRDRYVAIGGTARERDSPFINFENTQCVTTQALGTDFIFKF